MSSGAFAKTISEIQEKLRNQANGALSNLRSGNTQAVENTLKNMLGEIEKLSDVNEEEDPSSSPSSRVSRCARLSKMLPAAIYGVGIYGGEGGGIGRCYIINNNGNYGVMHESRGQISPTYKATYSRSVFENNMDAATGFYQSVCSGACQN